MSPVVDQDGLPAGQRTDAQRTDAQRSDQQRPDEKRLTSAAVALMRGVVDRDSAERTWHDVLHSQHALRDHVGVLALDLVIDEAEGYAYLRSRPDDPDDPQPRLVPRHRLSFPVSLLLALLRKMLAEFDASAVEGKLVVTRDRLVDEIRPFRPATSNDARLVDEVDRSLRKVVDLGFARPLPGESGAYEVRRILKAFIDAQWLGEFDERLAAYAAASGGDPEAGDD